MVLVEYRESAIPQKWQSPLSESLLSDDAGLDGILVISDLP